MDLAWMKEKFSLANSLPTTLEPSELPIAVSYQYKRPLDVTQQKIALMIGHHSVADFDAQKTNNKFSYFDESPQVL